MAVGTGSIKRVSKVVEQQVEETVSGVAVPVVEVEEKPAVKKPVARKPATKKPAAKNSVAKQPTTKETISDTETVVAKKHVYKIGEDMPMYLM